MKKGGQKDRRMKGSPLSHPTGLVALVGTPRRVLRRTVGSSVLFIGQLTFGCAGTNPSFIVGQASASTVLVSCQSCRLRRDGFRL